MRTLFTYTVIVVFLFSLTSSGLKVTEVSNESLADLKVYVTTERSETDLIVFFVSDPSFSDGDGLWYLESELNLSDKAICYVQDRFRADLIICITNNKSEAGKP